MGDNTSEEIDFHALFNAAPDLYCMVVPDEYRIMAVSDAFLAATGTRRENLVGEPLFKVFPADPDDPVSKDNINSLRDSLDRVQASGREHALVEQRYPVLRPDSDGNGFEERYWNATNTPVLDQEGRLKYILHRTEDVTEQVRLRRQAEGRERLETHAQKVEADLVQNTLELERLNEHLRFAQEVAKLGSWELRIKDNQRIWSDEVYRILGLSRDEVPQGADSATLIEKVVHPDDRQMMRDMRQRLDHGENISAIEHRIIRPDGQVRHVRERIEMISDESGKPQRLFGTMQDITEFKQTQSQLRQSEELLRIAGDMAKLGAWQWKVSEQRVTWSEEVCDIHEIEKPCTSVPFEDAVQFVAPEWRDTMMKKFEACARDGAPYDAEYEIVTARGNRRWARAIGKAFLDDKGKVIYVQGAIQDITERKQAEAETVALGNRLTGILEKISDAFVAIDNDWRVTYMNDQAARILQRPREALLGKNLWDAFPDAIDTQFHRMYHLAKDENRTVRFEEYYAPLDTWVDVSVYPSPNGMAFYFRDITERKRIEAAKRESEERTQLILENALDAVISIDNDSVITGWNRQAALTFGWSQDEATGQKLYELIIPRRFREAHRRGVDHFLEEGEGPLLNRRVEIFGLRKNGHEFPVELSIVPIKAGDGYTFSAFVRDITEQKKAEEALHDYTERLAATFEKVQVGICETGLDGRYLRVNPAFAQLVGYAPHELEGKPFADITHPEDRNKDSGAFHRLISGDLKVYETEKRYIRRDGETVWAALRSTIIRSSDGQPLYALTTMYDITKRKEYELRLSQQAALLDKAHDAIIVRDMNGRITFWNKGAERIYGWKAEEVLGRKKRELLHEDPGVFDEGMRLLVKHGEWTGQIKQQCKNGKTITVDAAWSLVTGEDGEPTAVLGINSDVTERLALEEQLRQSQRLETVGKLTGGVAHDFNNLLTVILGNAELMADQLPSDNRLHKMAAMTRDAASRGAELTHRLLAFSRQQALEPKVLDINHLLVNIEGLLRRALPESINIEVVEKDDLWGAFVDPAQLEAVVLNLALNAKDAMPEGGRLTVETDNVRLDEEYASRHAEVVAGRYVMIAVSDTGTGIPPDILDRVFDPFFTTKEKGKGTGLGLSMAYGFTKQSGGHIKIYSEPGQGTTVKVYLPRAGQAEERPNSVRTVENELSGHEKVLVVEDDDLVRSHAASQLEAFGYDVLAASNGPAALAILESEPDIDLLFTDVIMSGGMNGRELAERAVELRPDLKVLYTSGYTENAIVHHGRLDEGVQLLQKPYRRHDLAKKVREVLSNASNNPGGADDGTSVDTR